MLNFAEISLIFDFISSKSPFLAYFKISFKHSFSFALKFDKTKFAVFGLKFGKFRFDKFEICESGEFAEGSMLPKVEACMYFIEHTKGKKAIITSLAKAKFAIEGKTGTTIVKK